MYPKGYRGFESHSLRQVVCGCRDFAPASRDPPRNSRAFAGSWERGTSESEPETASSGPMAGSWPRSSLLPSLAVPIRFRFAPQGGWTIAMSRAPPSSRSGGGGRHLLMLSSRRPGDLFDTGRCCLYVAVGELVGAALAVGWLRSRTRPSQAAGFVATRRGMQTLRGAGAAIEPPHRLTPVEFPHASGTPDPLSRRGSEGAMQRGSGGCGVCHDSSVPTGLSTPSAGRLQLRSTPPQRRDCRCEASGTPGCG